MLSADLKLSVDATQGGPMVKRKSKQPPAADPREAEQRAKRLEALKELRAMADRGDFDEFVGNKSAYRR